MTRIPGFPHQKDGSTDELVSLFYTYSGDNYSDSVFQDALNQALIARGRVTQPPESCVRERTSILDHFREPPPPPQWSEYEDGKLRSALDYVGADGNRVWDPNAGREIWSKKVAAAIASLGWGNKGEDIFVYWSAQTTIKDYFPGDEACRQEVQSYKRGRDADCITERSIYKAVIDAGWTEPDFSTENSSSDGFFFTNDSGPQADATTTQQRAIPTIRVIGGGLSDEATAGEQAIINAGYPIYRRDVVLVRTRLLKK